MNDTRIMVMELVLKGGLSIEYVTLEELQEVEEVLFDLIAAKNTPYETFEVLQ
jgi:hypothetical protein|tara:strand:- start:406 stop:564 length:159 start_codon:yes stop_codon:yes gene_type:complete